MNNSGNNLSLPSFEHNSTETANIGVQLVVGLTTMISVLLNVPVIIIMISGRCMGKTITNIHILSLSFSDLLTCVSLLPVYQSFTVRQISYYECWTRLCVFCFAIAVSIIHLCFICLDRIWAILQRVPVSLKQARIRFWIIVIASWSTSGFITVTPFAVYEKNYDLPYCAVRTLFCNRAVPILKSWSMLLLFAEILIIGSCVLMVLVLYRSIYRKGLFSHHSSSKNVVHHRRVSIPDSTQINDKTSSNCSLFNSGKIDKNMQSENMKNRKLSALKINKMNVKEAWIEDVGSDQDQAGPSLTHEFHFSTKKERHRNSVNRKHHSHFYNLRQERDELPLSVQYLKALSTGAPTHRPRRPRTTKHQVRAVITLIILAVILFLTMTPMIVFVVFMEGWFKDYVITRQVRHTLVYLGCLNSAFNPIIYASRIPEIRSRILAWKNKITCR
ncbi:alpha-2C adrenergic receptor-like [Pecten maximus]|uniref:alpha-2C adrenergic receptor-like n=1 Tax=Pecten maximus TaxID=6579 RepID=UPI001458D386|nr:alpha-2C adrenergic receptor-like [Pecten maximus]